MNRLIRVKVLTPKGERTLTYEPTSGDTIVCLRGCVYKDVCDKIRDPRNPEDPDGAFTDFCSECANDLDEETQRVLANCIPKPGTIEENLYDLDIVQELIEKNPLVSVNKVIDSVCSGWCDSYNEKKSNCNARNGMCILRSIFIKDSNSKDAK